MNTMETELKRLIIDTLALEDVDVADIDSEAPLFDGGLGLDSIDALELGVAIRKRYGVKIDAEQHDVAAIFASVASLARFLATAGSAA
ncbi:MULTISPECIES: phosphopantetheine-binding protein [unclassified Methylomonas]|uniref:phosphopantetheine-binding protein n=2 Tax=unclassified Methylomonas TaxID=2608980 RepID=UPI0008D8E46C|nr:MULTISPECIES: phosphopantetheine-binding protein [unclassified Methylomonas]MDT4331399.1 phosphopantetheine-binding protein [Methylomonas sp. MV1]OHX36106.1 acyl carrier protein [Methylomonas sp. LWB]WGS84466.1 phosphopantetheine-binding protein [Methylomonas sp. UP202]